MEEAAAVLDGAQDASDPVVAAISSIVWAAIDAMTEGSLSKDERWARLEAALEALEAAGHDEGLGLYWWAASAEHWIALRAAETVAACERGIYHFRRAGSVARTEDLIWWIPSGHTQGPTPATEALERIETLYQDETLYQETGGSILRAAGGAAARTRLLAMQGDIDRARELLSASRETMRAAGMAVSAAGLSGFAAWIEQRAGDSASWEQELRSGLAELERLDAWAFASTIALDLAVGLYEQGRFEEVRELCALAREKSPPDDLVNFIYADALDGCLLGHDGRFDEAQRLVADVLERVERTDFFNLRAEIRIFMSEVLALNGKIDAATAFAEEALEIRAAKGDVTGAARTRERLATLGIEVA